MDRDGLKWRWPFKHICFTCKQRLAGLAPSEPSLDLALTLQGVEYLRLALTLGQILYADCLPTNPDNGLR